MSAQTLSTEAYTGIGIVSAGVLDLLGIPIQPVVWGLIGGVVGAGWAKPAKLPVAVAIYLSSSLISALAGHTLSMEYANGSAPAANTLAAVVAVFFHPLLAAGAEKAPMLWDWLLSLPSVMKGPK